MHQFTPVSAVRPPSESQPLSEPVPDVFGLVTGVAHDDEVGVSHQRRGSLHRLGVFGAQFAVADPGGLFASDYKGYDNVNTYIWA